MNSSNREKIRNFFAELLAAKGDAEAFADADSLYALGRIDSLDVIEVISFLEENFALDLSTLAFNPGLIDSVDAVITLVAREPGAA